MSAWWINPLSSAGLGRIGDRGYIKESEERAELVRQALRSLGQTVASGPAEAQICLERPGCVRGAFLNARRIAWLDRDPLSETLATAQWLPGAWMGLLAREAWALKRAEKIWLGAGVAEKSSWVRLGLGKNTPQLVAPWAFDPTAAREELPPALAKRLTETPAKRGYLVAPLDVMDPIAGADILKRLVASLPGVRVVGVPGGPGGTSAPLRDSGTAGIIFSGPLRPGALRQLLENSAGVLMPSLWAHEPPLLAQAWALGVDVAGFKVGGLRHAPPSLQGVKWMRSGDRAGLEAETLRLIEQVTGPLRGSLGQKRLERARENQKRMSSWLRVVERLVEFVG